MSVTRDMKTNLQACQGRLIILVPEQVEDLTELAHQVYEQAMTRNREVVYLSLARRGADDMPAARTLATLTALTRDSFVRASMIQVSAEHWAGALRLVARPGDMVLCPDDGMRVDGSTYPSGALNAEQKLNRIRAALYWITGLMILVCFSYLEFRLPGVASGAWKKVILFALFAGEIGTLYVWNIIISRTFPPEN